MLIPTVIEKTMNGERAYDIYSRLLNVKLFPLTISFETITCLYSSSEIEKNCSDSESADPSVDPIA